MYDDVSFYALRAFLAPPIKADLPEVLSETALHASYERLPTFFRSGWTGWTGKCMSGGQLFKGNTWRGISNEGQSSSMFFNLILRKSIGNCLCVDSL